MLLEPINLRFANIKKNNRNEKSGKMNKKIHPLICFISLSFVNQKWYLSRGWVTELLQSFYSLCVWLKFRLFMTIALYKLLFIFIPCKHQQVRFALHSFLILWVKYFFINSLDYVRLFLLLVLLVMVLRERASQRNNY